MFDFGKHADYMALGYAMAGILLAGMVLWMALRYRALHHEEALIDQIEVEERDEHAG